MTAESGRPEARVFVQERLRHWWRDSDLAGLRDQQVLAKLPAGEREALQKLWNDAEALLKKAQEKLN